MSRDLLFGKTSSVGIVNTTSFLGSSLVGFRFEFLKPFHNLKNLENVTRRSPSSLPSFRFCCDVNPTSIFLFPTTLLLARRSENVSSICSDCLRFSSLRFLKVKHAEILILAQLAITVCGIGFTKVLKWFSNIIVKISRKRLSGEKR